MFIKNEQGELTFQDGYTKENLPKENNLLETVYRDGKLIKEQSLADIRNI